MDGIEVMAAELVRKYSHIDQVGQKLFQSEKETWASAPAAAIRSIRAKRTSPVQTGPAGLSCGRMTVFGLPAARN